jgi:hypothetical protein
MSPLADLERAFRQVTRGPLPLTIDGRNLGADLSPRAIPLDELRWLLLQGPVTYETKDRALGSVATKAQRHGDTWTVGFAGMMMPGLKRVARRLERAPGVERDEVGPEVVAAVIESIAHLDTSRERIAARVCWEVYRRARCALDIGRPRCRYLAELTVLPPASAVPGTNPEEVLTRAVRAGVVTPADAELVALTRIEGRRLTDVAERIDLPFDRLQKRRIRAEARVAQLLECERRGDCCDDDAGRRSDEQGRLAPQSDRLAMSRYRDRPRARVGGAVSVFAGADMRAAPRNLEPVVGMQWSAA